MKTKISTIMMFGLFTAIGVVFSGCSSLNPNTEGHILSALEARKGEFQSCYQSALERNRETRGTVTLKLKIDEVSGDVTSSSVEQSNIGDNSMNQCVSNAASAISLPEPPGLPVEGNYDINFDFE
jgi:TonB family protein